MNEATIKRMALAQRIAPAYAANPKVRAVLLAGSVARGTADHFSDIEIDVFWAEPPSDDERRRRSSVSAGRYCTAPPTRTSGPMASSSRASKSTPASSWSRRSSAGWALWSSRPTPMSRSSC